MIVPKRALAVLTGVVLFSGVGLGTANAVKPSQGSSFDTGTCTTTTGHGSNATQTTDNGACTSTDNPNKGTQQGGTNTGHGFVAG
jgi:hypothetical protein